MEGKLLLVVSRVGVPDDGRLVHSCAEDVISTLVPLERKDGTLMLSQCPFQIAAR